MAFSSSSSTAFLASPLPLPFVSSSKRSQESQLEERFSQLKSFLASSGGLNEFKLFFADFIHEYPNSFDSLGWSPLCFAISHKRSEIALFLIEEIGVSTVCFPEEGEDMLSPLLLTIYNDLDEVALKIIAKDDLNIFLSGKDGETPLFAATKQGKDTLVKELAKSEYCHDDFVGSQNALSFAKAQIESGLDPFGVFQEMLTPLEVIAWRKVDNESGYYPQSPINNDYSSSAFEWSSDFFISLNQPKSNKKQCI